MKLCVYEGGFVRGCYYGIESVKWRELGEEVLEKKWWRNWSGFVLGFE